MDGKEQQKKESYTNTDEANAVADYFMAFGDQLDLKTTAVMTPFRTQALLIKNVIQDERKADLGKKISAFQTIGSFEDFVSRSKFSTLIISVCKTEKVEEQGGPLLNEERVLNYVKSRQFGAVAETKKIIVIGKASALSTLWREEFYSAKGVEVIERSVDE